MSTEQVLLEARLAVTQAQSNSAMVALALVLTIAGTVLWFDYVLRRWSWIPRKRHNRTYIEKF